MGVSNKKKINNTRKSIRRNNMKKFISLLISIFMILGLSVSIVRAEENESYDYTYKGIETWGKNITVNGENVATALFKVENPDGSISYAYCVDLDTLIKNRHNYSRVNVEDSSYYSDESAKHIRAIVRNAYPFVSLEEISSTLNLKNLTKEEAIAATQIAIWKYANSANVPDNLTGNIGAIYNYLIGLEGVEGQISVANIITKDPIVHLNGENCDIEFIFKADGKNADGTNIKLNYTIEGKSEESTDTNLGVDDEGYTHIKVTNVKSQENIKFIVQGVQDVGTDVFFYGPQGGREQSQSLIGIQSGNTNVSKTFEFKLTFGEVTVKKVDSDNQDIVIKGAEFTIKNDKGEVAAVITTDQNGIASSKLLPGNYTIEETKAPEGYLIVNGQQEFTIEEGQTESVSLLFTNKKDLGTIILTKVDADDETKTLSGVGYELYDEALNKIDDFITGEDGKITVDSLVPGTYFFRETKPQEGYVQDLNEIYFTIESNQQTATEVTAKNTKIKGSIEITKVDENENPLANAEFVIKNEAGEIVSKAKTDEEGVVKFIDLIYGKYTYQEVTAPDGYEIDNTEYSFEIKENGEIIKASQENKKESQEQDQNEDQDKDKDTTTNTNKKPNNTTTNKKPSTPKTGEIGLAGVVAVLLLAGGGLLINNRKKKDK
ncbi:MAG: thioester domain-containing protein [uncultured Clostridium sp.]